MRRVKNLVAIGAFALLIMGIPAIASAQYNGGYGNGGYGNGGYGNNGGYGDMRSVVRDLKSRTSQFQRELDRDLDHSRINGSRREDQINQLARDFKSAVNRLDNNGYNNNRGDNDLRRVADLASQIDRSIGRSNLSYNGQNLWQGIRNDLRQLGAGYGSYNNNNRNYPNNNRNNYPTNNRNGGWNNRPSWWPF